MSRAALPLPLLVLVGAVAFAPLRVDAAVPADGEARDLAELAPATGHDLGGTADLRMRLVQEDGPLSGHVRVLLTPESRALDPMEVRSAAQQGFLEALNDRGLGPDLTRITVVVRTAPAAGEGLRASEQVFRFLLKGGRSWAVLPPE